MAVTGSRSWNPTNEPITVESQRVRAFLCWRCTHKLCRPPTCRSMGTSSSPYSAQVAERNAICCCGSLRINHSKRKYSKYFNYSTCCVVAYKSAPLLPEVSETFFGKECLISSSNFGRTRDPRLRFFGKKTSVMLISLLDGKIVAGGNYLNSTKELTRYVWKNSFCKAIQPTMGPVSS
jgi:hypothetical protein